MAKKTINSDIYNLSKLVDDVKSTFIPNETDETLAISTYGYLGALESHRLQTQVQMTGELCNEVFPSRARLERNVITHAIMTNIENINAIPAKMTVFLSIKESDIKDYFDDKNIFTVDRECPIYIGDYEFHLEYDIKITKIKLSSKRSGSNTNQDNYAYTARYYIPDGRDVPTSTITSANQYLSPPTVINIEGESYILLTCILAQVEHNIVSKKLVTSNIIDNKTINFDFQNQLAYFEIHCSESDEEYYITPVFEGSSVPESNSQYYCWYQYIDTNLIRVRFDRKSYMPGLNATVECLIKTCQGDSGNFTYGEDTYVTLESSTYGYKNITCLLTPVTDSADGKDRKSKKELQSLIPKESLARGCLTTITDLNNYFSMIDSEFGRVVIQKKIDNQIERVYYAYLVAKDANNDVIPSNTVDIKVGLDHLIKSQIYETDPPRYLLPAGTCFRLGSDGVAYINDTPLLDTLEELTPEAVARGEIVEVDFTVEVTSDDYDSVSCGVDVGGSDTNTHVFPKSGSDRFTMIEVDDNTLVEDYIQLGTGQNYTYTATYTTEEANTIMTAKDSGIDCFDFVEAFYTANGVTKKFTSLPIVAYGLPENTKVTFGITRKLNTKAKGMIYFKLGDKVYKYNQVTSGKLSTILAAYGIEGEVTGATSSDPTKLLLTENGTIEPEPTPEPNPYTLKVSDEENLPEVKDREENEWFYVVERVKERSEDSTNTADEEGNPYNLTVAKEEDLPPIEEREENDWFYVIQKTKEQKEAEDAANATDSTNSEDYVLHVENQSDLPPIAEREENHWWYSVHSTQFRKEIPDEPDVPTTLTGKEYDVDIINNFQGETLNIRVAVGNAVYDIKVTQDRHMVENGIYITDADEDVKKTIYGVYVPTLDQDVWPQKLIVGNRINYKLRYRSTSNTYTPKLTIVLSKGLKYVPFSCYIIYPDGRIVQFEPSEVIVDDKKTKFVYTNPYAVNINGYRLYSAFYMMAMDENPYFHFDYINEKSNVQFISTNAYWNRKFTGNDTDQYTLTCTLSQSVKADIGISPETDDETSEKYFTPLVKAIAVFKRNGKAYRYRSMDLVSYDSSDYSYTFSQVFNSKDIFDNDNNIKVTNVQVVGQSEYTVNLAYNNKTSVINNGATRKLSEILTELGITLENEIESVVSNNRSSLDVYKDSDTDLYMVRSFNDFPNFITEYDEDTGIGTYKPVSITLVEKNDEKTTYVITATSSGPSVFTVSIGDSYTKKCNISDQIKASEILTYYGIEYTSIKTVLFSAKTNSIKIDPYYDASGNLVDFTININRDFNGNAGTLSIDYDDTDVSYEMSSTATEYGFFEPNSELKIYALCGLPGTDGKYDKNDLDSICPGLDTWSVTNIYDVVNGVTMYHNYSEIMGSRCTPYGDDSVGSEVTTMDLKGYYVKGIPMLGYEYCQDETLAQAAIDALNYRKAYIDSAVALLENSFGIDFKLFNTYGPSNTYYVIKDTDKNNVLDDSSEFIGSVNLTLYFRTKLVSDKDSYTKNNIIEEIKSYIEDLDDLSELHIPNLITQITNNYKEQISYFEYLGFNDYGPEVQHIYKLDDDYIPIHTPPEFLNVNNVLNGDGTVSPDINIYISEI